jgi:glycosyltransferase
MVPNWNHCLSLAKGKYVTILHDDDLLSATFSRCVNRLLLEGELPSEMLGFHVDILDFRFPGADQKKRSVMMPEVIGNLSNESAFFEMKARSIIEFFFGNPFCGTLGIVMDRSKALEIGGFIPSWYPISDYEFWCRWICKRGPISIIPQRVGLYRIQENESFRLDVQSSFVEMSTKLRLLLLLNGEVPSFFKYLIGNLAVVQLHYIRSFWDLKYQKPSLFLSDFFLRKWHFFESVLFFFYRKYTRTPQRK